MSALLQQVLVLVGVVIGAFGSYFAAKFGNRERIRREDAVRWADRRLAAYTAYSQALKAVVGIVFRLSAHLGNDPNPHPLTQDEAFAELRAAYAARDAAWEALLLLGSHEVVAAARAWFGAVTPMERFVKEETRDPAAWSALLHDQRLAKAAFYAAARRDLALPAEDQGR